MLRTFQIWLCIAFLAIGIYSGSRKAYNVLSYKCVGCEDCINVCPKDAIEIKRGKAVIDVQMCIGCGQCAYICSFNAVRRYKER